MPQFNIHLYSPTSTSVRIEVALRFFGESGMILEMNNCKGAGRILQGMDCSWFSRYPEEDERYVHYHTKHTDSIFCYNTQHLLCSLCSNQYFQHTHNIIIYKLWTNNKCNNIIWFYYIQYTVIINHLYHFYQNHLLYWSFIILYR